MTRVICVAAGKGGVGKTTTVSNLGAALSKFGKDVTLIDTNLTTPNLSLHLGIPLYPITLHDVLRGQAYITEAMHIHSSGLRVVPASLSLDDLDGTDPADLSTHLDDLAGTTDLVFLDCSAGLGSEAIGAMKSADDLLLVSNPELPAVTDVLKTKKLAEEMGINVLGIVLTRMNNRNNQMSDREIEEMLEIPILGKIPEDRNISHALRNRSPVVLYKPTAPASKAYNKLAADMIGVKYSSYSDVNFFRRFKSFLAG